MKDAPLYLLLGLMLAAALVAMVGNILRLFGWA